MKYDAIVIHFGEIWLKGRNRNSFISMLSKNIKSHLNGIDYKELALFRDRFLLYLNTDQGIEDALGRLNYVFGISWFAPVRITKSSINEILKVVSELQVENRMGPYRIEVHRSDKSLPFTSVDVVSAFIKHQDKLPFEINKNSDKIIFISVTRDKVFICTEKIRGLGGLPVSSSGKAIVLISGGIDSPVASYYAMKRGLEPTYLHIHAFASNDEAKRSKLKEIMMILGKYSDAKMYYAPGYIFQSYVAKSPSRYEVILFKMFMYRLAERLAAKEGAKVIVTGESLGQVASQTVDNIVSSSLGIKSLVMRPLIGFDKEEIIRKSKELGLFDISIQGYADVCSISARNPTTSANPKLLKTYYKSAKLEIAIRKTLARAEPENFAF